MGSDRGLPSLPRGLPRDLTTYLQGLSTVVLRLSGNVRGSEQVRAVRVSEGVSTAAGSGRPGIGQNEILSWNLANRAVTTEKMVDGCVTSPKLANGAVTEGKLADEAVVTGKLAERAVTSSKLADGAVTAESIKAGAITEDAIADGAVQGTKLASGVLPVFHAGTAVDGETVVLPGIWVSAPAVMLTLISLPPVQAPEQEPDSGLELAEPTVGLSVGVTGLREVMADTGADGDSESDTESGAGTGTWEFVAAGNFEWVAMGYAHGTLK